jgi:asparagine N-glycosylation enzyme membrane subunit Stt3
VRREISILLAVIVLGATLWMVGLLAALSVVTGGHFPRLLAYAVIGAAIALLVAAWARLRAFAAAALVVWMTIVVGAVLRDVDYYAEHRKWLVGTVLVASAAILSVLLIPEPRRDTTPPMPPPAASGHARRG